MSLFLVACLLNRWKRASSARCLQKKTRGLTTPRSSKPPACFDIISAEIEVSQRCALAQHSCKPLCPACFNVIAPKIEVSQRCALRQKSCKCPAFTHCIAPEIEVSQRCALRQHSCKPFCPVWSEIRIVAEIKGTAPALLQVSLHLVLSFHGAAARVC